MKYNINETDFVIFFMGYLYDFAGLQKIIQYYNEKVNEGMNLKFLIVGDGGDYNALLSLKEKLHADWVMIVGRVSFFDISNYIELANLCILSFEINEITRKIIPIKIIEYLSSF